MISLLSDAKSNNKYSINLIDATLSVIVAEASEPSSLVTQILNENVHFDENEIVDFVNSLIEQGFVSVDQRSKKTKLTKNLNTILQTFGAMNSNYSYYLQ